MFRKISNRIIASYIVLILALIVVLLFLIMDHIREYHHAILKREMEEKIDFIDLEIRNAPGRYLAGTVASRETRVKELSHIINLRITLVDLKGRVIADSQYDRIDEMDNHRYRSEIQYALEHGMGDSIRYSATLGSNMLYVAKKTGTEVIRLAKPLREVDESIALLRRYILVAGGIALVLSSLAVVVMARRITRPISETMSFARDFTSGDFSRRIPNYSNDEIGTLQNALNRLADTVVEKLGTLMFEQIKLEKTIESIADGIAVIGRDRRILVANAAFRSLLDIDGAMVGKVFFEAIRNRMLNTRIEEVHATGRSEAFEETFLNGRYFEIIIKPVTGEQALQGILVIIHDNTERKRIEQMKTDLVANMSHELKTPIAILKGYLETMEPHLSDPDMARDLLKKAILNVDRQNSLVNDILKLNRLETAKDFQEGPIRLEEVIKGCIDILSPKAGTKDIAMTFQHNGFSGSTMGNRFLAEEVFFNIIDNAISYNREGGSITVTMSPRAERTVVIIADTGIGIPEEALERIFERFYRVDKSRSRSTGGTGLGLSIVKHAAEILGWKIWVKSGPEGTTFTVEA